MTVQATAAAPVVPATTGTTGAAPPAAAEAPKPAAAAAPATALSAAPVTTPEAKADGATPAGEAAKPAGTPEAKAAEAAAAAEYKLTLPEGFVADEGLEKFTAFAKEAGIKPEAAQKVLDLHAASMKSAVSGLAQKVLADRGMDSADAWPEQLKADKEFGGAKYDANIAGAQKAIAKFGSPELKEFFEKSGVGNHPALVRAFVKIGKAMAEDSVAGMGGGVGGAGARTLTEAERLKIDYPTMFKE